MVKEGEGLIETTLSAIGDFPPEPADSALVEVPMPVEPEPLEPADECVYVSTDADGFIEGISSSPMGDHSVEIHVPSDHPIFDEGVRLWQLVDGKLEKPEGRLDSIIAEDALRPPESEEQLKAENMALTKRIEFLEEVIVEMIFSIY